MTPYLIDDIKVQLLNAAYCELDSNWNYTNIVSPFTRIYLISSGSGYIYPDNQAIELKEGHLYLIPSYVHCSYHCKGLLSQYYIHFTNQLADGLKIFDSVSMSFEVKANKLDYLLFDRLLKINPRAELIQSDPNIYQRKSWVSAQRQAGSSGTLLETSGILKQLLARFVQDKPKTTASLTQMSRLRKVFRYINSNLRHEIRIDTLAEIACYSTDHFTRQFKQTTGLLPVEYINKKRVEMAQLLLLTSSKTQKEISEEVGFSCQQYYSRVFKKQLGCSPAQYRKLGGFV